MRASACVGRVAGLAVALGIGAAIAFGYPGSASGAPADDTTTAGPPAGSTAVSTPRSRRTAKAKAAAPAHDSARPVPDPAAQASIQTTIDRPPALVDRVRIPPSAGLPAAPPVPAPTFSAVTPIAAATEAPAAVAAPAKTVTPVARLAAVTPAAADLSGNGAPAQGPLGWVLYAAVRRPAAARIVATAAATSTGQLFIAPGAARTASANASNPILSFFFNQTPTDSPTRTAQSATSVINGDLNVTDDDSDVLTYTVVSNPTHGTVSVDAAGHYVYTPNADLVASGGLDSFQVRISDADSGFHIHGIMGLLNLLTFGLLGSSGHTTTSTIDLSVLTATAAAGTPSVSTGVLTGTVTAGGAAGDQFAYSGSATSKGEAVVDAGGGFTYTPTASARHAAAKLDAPAADKSDTFTIGITDSYGGAMNVPITTAITPANNAPTATSNVGAPNATTGLVAGAILGMDADNDPLTYTGSTTTSKGTVVVNADGSFTYSPTALARHNAAFNSDTADSFTVTIVDGYGGSVNIPVSVVVSPAAVTFDWASGSGSQFWTAANMAALNTAATRLSSYIVVGTPVTIVTTLIGQNNPSSNFLASSYSNFSSGGAGYYGTVVQTKILSGVDANGGAADSQLTWNFAYPWALGNSVPGNQYDFQSVAMHEIMHSLGFLSGISSPGTNDTNWSTYDSFLSTANGTAVINGDYTYNATYNANLTGGNGGLYFDGPNAVAVYGGLVPLYTPSTWTSGSSVTHLRATPVLPSGTAAYLMDPSDGYGLGVRVITPVEIGIMRDLGYTMATPSSASVFVFFGFGLIRRRRRTAER